MRVRLDPVESSEQADERPALVLSSDLINQNSPVVLIAAITSRKVERVYPFEALLGVGEGGLSQTSKVLLMQLRSIDKRRIVRRLGSVKHETMRRVEEALRIATGLAG